MFNVQCAVFNRVFIVNCSLLIDNCFLAQGAQNLLVKKELNINKFLRSPRRLSPPRDDKRMEIATEFILEQSERAMTCLFS